MDWVLVFQFIATGILGALIGFWMCWRTEVKPRVKMLTDYKHRMNQFYGFVSYHRLHHLWVRYIP